MQTKVCSKCGVEKEICEFHKQNSNKSGYRASCKLCRKSEKEKNLIYRKNNKEKVSKKNIMWLERNPNYMKEYHKKYNIENREKISEKTKRWREKNKEKILEKERIKRKEKYENDKIFKVSHLLRSRINKIVKFKRDKSSKELLGCSIDEFLLYIEEKFTEGMCWDNYGYYGWHIDHIVPLSSAKTKEEFLTLCHYTNLQPLWGIENIKKSNKIIKK